MGEPQVSRRIGGLEKSRSDREHLVFVSRRIGGLERPVADNRGRVDVSRRIGGLEIKSGMRFTGGRLFPAA